MERVFSERLVYFLRGDWWLLIRVGLKEAEFQWTSFVFVKKVRKAQVIKDMVAAV